MKTKPETKECSVMVAFAELGRLERERAELVAAKQSVQAKLNRQARELASLRERFEAERPRAIARARRERAHRERLREQLTARLIAEAETAHDERLGLIRAELEAKRLRLAALEVVETVPRPSRRWLEWSVPVAAAALVAFMGFALLDEEHAVAQPAEVEHSNFELEANEVDEAAVVVEEVAAPEVVAEPTPVPVEPAPESKPIKKSSTKKSNTKKSSDEPKTETKPIKKNTKPLELGDFGGDPLG